MQNIKEEIKVKFQYYLDQSLPVLTREKEKEKFTRYASGETFLLDELVRHNLKLVINIAKKFIKRAIICGIDFDDLMQLGSLGLMKAIKKFEVERDLKFSTYAVWWIKQPIMKELENKSENNLMFLEDIRINILHNLSSFDNFITEEDILLNLMINFNEKIGNVNFSPEEQMNLDFQKDMIKNLLFDCLDERKRKIIYTRFFEENTLREAEETFNLSAERIRQIQTQAIDILRENKVCQDLIKENFCEK